STDRTEPEKLGAVFRNRNYPGTGKVAGASCRSIERKLPCLPVDPGECSDASHPDIAMAVLINRGCVIHVEAVGIAGLMPVATERQRLLRKPIDATPRCSHPNIPLAILEHRVHLIRAQAVPIAGIAPVADESFAVAIQLQKSTSACAKPQDPILIFVNRAHSALQRVVRAGTVEGVEGEFVCMAVHHCQTIPVGESNPENTGVIFAECD